MSRYAHSLPCNPDRDLWEPIENHEQAVAALSEGFLKRIDSGLAAWGDLLGRWHDVGKYSDEFQNYLACAGDVHGSEVSGKVDHSTAGAQLAIGSPSPFGKLIAYALAGHHTGLPDWDVATGRSGLKQRLEKQVPRWQSEATKHLESLRLPATIPVRPPEAYETYCRHRIASFRICCVIRMMFSALVDADFLATEAFMSPEQSGNRQSGSASMDDLAETLDGYLNRLRSGAKPSPVNQIRDQVSEACIDAAELVPGLFSLNVPTGGGKTLSSLQFALRHSVRHGLDGVIVGIPFTSIIEQNAKVYRGVFESLGEGVVLEHHSNTDPEQETTQSRLQSENWDAPVVITTNNQLFESLFACRTSRCRKLHRIARRVIILDEVQSLPVELLTPTLLAIRELVESFGCTVVLCTATQPALQWKGDFAIGLRGIRDIIPTSAKLHDRLRRTTVRAIGKLNDEDLIARIEAENQTLCIVNTRPHASKLFAALDESEANFHLSTRMCAAHRLDVLNSQIRPRLDNGTPCRVISTQLIEAGVDVDFPVVFRDACGIDSLTQAAGRCNREGRAAIGNVYYFQGERRPPPGTLRMSADHGLEIARHYDDLLSPEAIEAYFRMHYWQQKDRWDFRQVMDAIGRDPSRMEFQFRQIADRYRFIDEEAETLYVPWEKGKQLIRSLSESDYPPDRKLRRHLQRYSINLRRHELVQLDAAGALLSFHGYHTLTQRHLYDDKLGLMLLKADGIVPPEDYMC
ncbi:CRISPR-associated helicase Cas3' [Aporhodopirellula aestuarii]|uniref:CRISPR-associated helicase Cas3 n=1 Tax=Aporhodopirellula aestuarii TaxID=2950107 RepID=A0ABT0UC33_9BACT|nr:CRISPR-associated helicase Cas3' [Aporhodopirellula aestuarii]MCM2373928.1 CRISPR-associated helicase Cas3' [Aporhodopirellula aestuarii]